MHGASRHVPMFVLHGHLLHCLAQRLQFEAAGSILYRCRRTGRKLADPTSRDSRVPDGQCGCRTYHQQMICHQNQVHAASATDGLHASTDRMMLQRLRWICCAARLWPFRQHRLQVKQELWVCIYQSAAENLAVWICRWPVNHARSSACSLRATARIWLQRPCCAAAAAQQEAQPLSKRQQKKQQQQQQNQQQQGGDKGSPAVTPRSADFSRHG
jgi:hypothetical protein